MLACTWDWNEFKYLLKVDDFNLKCMMSSITLYRQPTLGNTALHTTSVHPFTLAKRIPYSQYVQLKYN